MAANVVAWTTAGATMGAGTLAFDSFAGLYSASSPWAFILVPTIAAPLCLTAASVITQARARTLARREELVQEAIDAIAVSATQATIMADIRASIITAVDNQLAPARADVALQLNLLSTRSPLPPGDALHDAVHDSIRPIIERLATASAGVPPRIGFVATVASIIRTQPFRPTALSALFVIAAIPELATSATAGSAALLIMVGVAAIFLILGVANRLMARFPRHHAPIFIGAFFVLQLPSIIDIVREGEGGLPTVVSVLPPVIMGAALVLLTSELSNWQERNDQAQRTFAELLDKQRIESLARARVAADVAREAAITLHGPVQSRLAACAVAMDIASRSGDAQAYREALDHARDALNTPLFASDAREQRLRASLDSIIDPWRELVEVSLDLSTIPPETPAHPDVDRIVEEGITNAVRHGRAQRISVQIESTATDFHVTIDDDGSGHLTAHPGLGSTMIARVTDGRWSLDVSPALRGTRLSAVVSLSVLDPMPFHRATTEKPVG
jgi:hypothetical protein